MSEIKEETFISDISVAPSAVIFATNIKKPLSRYSLKFILNQTKLIILSSYDEDGKATRPGLLFRAHQIQPQESILLNYEPNCNISLSILRSYLNCFLHLSSNLHQDAVINKLLHETKINNGYNDIRPTVNRNNSIFNRRSSDNEEEEEMRPEFMKLAVNINVVNVEHFCVPPELRKSTLPSKTEECSVCLEEMDDNKQPLTSLCCDHVFHEACIVNWLASSNTTTATTTLSCPLCRSRIPVDKISC